MTMMGVPALLAVVPEFVVGRYRLDVAVFRQPFGTTPEHSLLIGVEVDGRSTHHATERQIAFRDARDSELIQ